MLSTPLARDFPDLVKILEHVQVQNFSTASPIDSLDVGALIGFSWFDLVDEATDCGHPTCEIVPQQTGTTIQTLCIRQAAIILDTLEHLDQAFRTQGRINFDGNRSPVIVINSVNWP